MCFIPFTGAIYFSKRSPVLRNCASATKLSHASRVAGMRSLLVSAFRTLSDEQKERIFQLSDWTGTAPFLQLCQCGRPFKCFLQENKHRTGTGTGPFKRNMIFQEPLCRFYVLGGRFCGLAKIVFSNAATQHTCQGGLQWQSLAIVRIRIRPTRLLVC